MLVVVAAVVDIAAAAAVGTVAVDFVVVVDDVETGRDIGQTEKESATDAWRNRMVVLLAGRKQQQQPPAAAS